MRRRKFRIRRWVALAAALVTLSFASSAAAIPVVDNDGGRTVGLVLSSATGAAPVSRPPDVRDAASAQASFSTPQGLKADGLRLQGIAQVYKQIGPETSFSTPQGLKADGLRLQGIAQVYQSQSGAVPDVLERYAAAHPYGVGLASATSSSEVVRPPDVSDAAYAARTIVPSQSSRFDWNDYAIGIGSGVGFTLLLAATLGVGWQQRRRMQTA
jgi:hypothetical protein